MKAKKTLRVYSAKQFVQNTFTCPIKKYIVLCFVVISIPQCTDHESSYAFNIKNDHSADIYYHINFSTIAKEDVIYPDTTLSFPRNRLVRVKQGTTLHDNIPTHPIEKWVSDLPYDTLSVYIFDKDTLDRYEWDKIQEDYKILKRYDLSVKDIRLLDKSGEPEIPCPPDERMKYMKMYPPYGTYNK
jgi:hypothetical protein